MATQVQFRRGTTAQHSSFTGVAGEVTVDTDKGTVVVHDGSTAGGAPLATEAAVNSKLATSVASATYVTKADAVASNNSILALVNDRLQVANASVYQTIAIERAAVANTNARLNVLEAGGALATNTYIVANYLQKTSTVSQSTAGDLKIDSSSETTGTHVKDGSVTIFTNTGSPAFVDFYCETSNAHRVRLQSAAHSEYSGNPNVTLPATSGTLALTASPAFTGTPTAPTAAGGTNTTQIATTAYVRGEVSGLVDSAPASLDTLNELAAALGDDANFSTTITNLIGTKLAVSNANITIAADSGSDDVVSIVTDTLTIAGANAITTTVSDNQVSINLDNTAVTPGSYGSSSAIPVLTVDQQGRLTAATTAAISSSLTVAADSGSNDTVTVGTDTLTFAGTANEIDTAVTDNQIQIGLVASPQVTGLTATGTIAAANFNSTSDVRLKKNIANSMDAGSIIDEMIVRQFDWIADDKHQEFGFIAQEVDQVYPDAVSQIGATWGINYNTIVPLLLKEIQELRKRIAALES